MRVLESPFPLSICNHPDNPNFPRIFCRWNNVYITPVANGAEIAKVANQLHHGKTPSFEIPGMVSAIGSSLCYSKMMKLLTISRSWAVS